MSDDLFGDLLNAARRSGAKHDDENASEEQPASKITDHKGLNPLDLLEMAPGEREVINWLSRRTRATGDEIQNALKKDAEQIQVLLDQLKEKGYIHEALINGEFFYRVVFKAKVGRITRGLPEDFWSRLDLDNTSFLKQVPLFRTLSQQDVEAVSKKLETRNYQRNEVILWQGEVSTSLFIIKTGIVGISRITPKSQTPEQLAYLREGDILGEYSLLFEQGRTTSATTTALSEVTMLVMNRADFYDMLQHQHMAAIELSKILAQRLVSSNTRQDGNDEDTNVCLVFCTEAGAGCTTIASSIAMTLAQKTQQTTVYTEYPDPHRLPTLFEFHDSLEVFKHPANYDVFVHRETTGMPPNVRVTLFLEELNNIYSNVVIGLAPEIDDTIAYLLERADQVVIVTPPGTEYWQKLHELTTQLKAWIHPDKTNLHVVINRAKPQYADTPPEEHADYEIMYIPEPLTSLKDRSMQMLPEALTKVTGALADHLGRMNQISIFIPTTIDVDVAVDTMPFVNKTLAFLGEFFGGATSSEAQGVWNSEQAGLVSETVHIVRSYATQADLDKHLPEILEYMEQLKLELKQEAMALEVNDKFMLI